MNALNTLKTTVNGKEIEKVETDNERRWGRFLCEYEVNGKTRRHWTTDMVDYIEDCNKYGWLIVKTTYFCAKIEKDNQNYSNLYNVR